MQFLSQEFLFWGVYSSHPANWSTGILREILLRSAWDMQVEKELAAFSPGWLGYPKTKLGLN